MSDLRGQQLKDSYQDVITDSGSDLAGIENGNGVDITSRIVERDSNSDGEWVRLADGTQIVFRYGNVDLTATSLSTNAMPIDFDHNFPVTISWSAAETVSAGNIDALQNSYIEYRQDNAWRFRTDGSGSSSSIQASFLAIGRWK